MAGAHLVAGHVSQARPLACRPQMAADVEMGDNRSVVMQQAEGAEAVEAHEVGLPVVGLHSRRLVQRLDGLLVQSLTDSYLCEK